MSDFIKGVGYVLLAIVLIITGALLSVALSVVGTVLGVVICIILIVACIKYSHPDEEDKDTFN